MQVAWRYVGSLHHLSAPPLVCPPTEVRVCFAKLVPSGALNVLRATQNQRLLEAGMRTQGAAQLGSFSSSPLCEQDTGQAGLVPHFQRQNAEVAESTTRSTHSINAVQGNINGRVADLF